MHRQGRPAVTSARCKRIRRQFGVTSLQRCQEVAHSRRWTAQRPPTTTHAVLGLNLIGYIFIYNARFTDSRHRWTLLLQHHTPEGPFSLLPSVHLARMGGGQTQWLTNSEPALDWHEASAHPWGLISRGRRACRGSNQFSSSSSGMNGNTPQLLDARRMGRWMESTSGVT